MKSKKLPVRLLMQISAGVLILVMLLGGTYAWSEAQQPKTNEFEGKGLRYNVSLVENFDKEADMQLKTPVAKPTFVSNLGETDAVAYIRLTLKEYMELRQVEYQYSDNRYAINDGTNNSYIGDLHGEYLYYIDLDGSDVAGARAYFAGLGYDMAVRTIDWFDKDGKVTPLIPGDDGFLIPASGWYLQTDWFDPDGQYGKFIVTKATPVDPAIPVIFGSRRGDTEHNELNGDHNEALWTKFIWASLDDPSLDNAIRAYIDLGLNFGDIMSLSDFMDPAGNNGNPIAAWIYDDTNPADAYIYWGEPLIGGAYTANILNDVTLKKHPDGDFYYGLRIEMEAVSFSDMKLWDGVAPNDLLLNAYGYTPAPHATGIVGLYLTTAGDNANVRVLAGTLNYDIGPSVNISGAVSAANVLGGESGTITNILPDSTDLVIYFDKDAAAPYEITVTGVTVNGVSIPWTVLTSKMVITGVTAGVPLVNAGGNQGNANATVIFNVSIIDETVIGAINPYPTFTYSLPSGSFLSANLGTKNVTVYVHSDCTYGSTAGVNDIGSFSFTATLAYGGPATVTITNIAFTNN